MLFFICFLDVNPSKVRCTKCYQLFSKKTDLEKHQSTQKCKRQHEWFDLVIKKVKIQTNDDENKVRSFFVSCLKNKKKTHLKIFQLQKDKHIQREVRRKPKSMPLTNVRSS